MGELAARVSGAGNAAYTLVVLYLRREAAQNQRREVEELVKVSRVCEMTNGTNCYTGE